VTNNKPLSSCFKKTTLFPRKRPAKRMRTVPGVMDFRRTVLDGFLRDFLGTETSSACRFQRSLGRELVRWVAVE
jgi:hypothetical protein